MNHLIVFNDLYTPKVTSFCDKSWERSLRTRLPETTPELWNGQWKQKQCSQASAQLSIVGEQLVISTYDGKNFENVLTAFHSTSKFVYMYMSSLVRTNICVRMSGVKTGSQTVHSHRILEVK